MKTLVAGIGNIFNRDDGFGVEVARRLVERPRPEGVRVEDFGIRGLHLTLELLEGYDLLVLVDAMAGGDEPPGTVFVVEPDGSDVGAAPLDAHSMDPHAVLGGVARLGGRIGRVVLVGCQPAELHEGMGLSVPVAAAVERAAHLVEDLITGRSPPCVVSS